MIPWKKDAPAFHVAELSQDDQAVRKHFRKPRVYSVGSHEGCGCGFKYGQRPPEDDKDKQDDAAARESVRHFAEYLSAAVEQADVQIYACWDGDQEDPPLFQATITPAEVGGDTFELKEKELLTVVKQKPWK